MNKDSAYNAGVEGGQALIHVLDRLLAPVDGDDWGSCVMFLPTP